MKQQDTTTTIIKLVTRFDKELKKQIEADLKVVERIKHNIIGRINPELNITTLFIA